MSVLSKHMNNALAFSTKRAEKKAGNRSSRRGNRKLRKGKYWNEPDKDYSSKYDGSLKEQGVEPLDGDDPWSE